MQRIVILGSGGAGKSTLALQLGEALGLPVFHLDALFWQPGWVTTPRDERRRTLEQLVRSDAWILDGNWGGTGLDVRLAAADTVIFLDLPRALCLWRVIRRWLAFRGRTRPDLGADCPERLDPAYLRWIWDYPRLQRPALLRRIEEYRDGRRVIYLRSGAEVRAFLAGIWALGGSSQATRPQPVARPTARVIVLDERGRILLWRVVAPDVDAPALWVTPGGTLEPDETYEQAALRELREETGLSAVTLGPCVWHRRHVWRWGDRWIDAVERFFLARVRSFEVRTAGQSPGEQQVVKGYRWWSAEELAAATGERFAPRRIAQLLPSLVAGELPDDPIDTGP
ncbi:MAG TPA: DNA topology modulation protein [Dehalococcoidia bacterium]|nr:DNA topology modulation protein [Dehalococcoidia bacterium]